MSDRLLGVFRLGHRGKRLGLRFLELLVVTAALLFASVQLEAKLHGSPYNQGWEFFAIIGALVLVAVFPGFVFKYLWRSRAV
ncbi:DUF2818 family protein [Zoogloea sp.]|uniref:DUF2818 family protein n=1 Tax=Zoogloea sp. TaxID=49181 RepID=UPI0035B44E3C